MRRITDTDEVHNEVQNHQCSTANSSKSTSQLYTTTTTSVRKETSYCKCRRAYCRGVDCCYVSVTYCLLFRCCGVVLDIIYSAAYKMSIRDFFCC